MNPYGALILAGGNARRLGGVHKPGLLIGGVRLLDRVLAAVPDAVPRVVVGPPQPTPPDVRVVREEPPGGGPVAALSAGITALADATQQAISWLALLAGDLPFLTPGVITALRLAAEGAEGAVLVDPDGRDQYLAGVYRMDALATAVTSVGPPSGVPLRRVVAGLDLVRVPAPERPGAAPPWLDCDDAEDIRAAEAFARQASDQTVNRPTVGRKEADG
ncbi:molybdenum cofactor guanylyltransferase [Cryptosporangium aurantiacum]|uniref:molybdenum cofactor guanylyltransferase n=1 Tax=Cryptosporangium aurantiacum TaxID=134849 RepID=UPI001C49D861|nr:NTP transferase domain-containing protein [Cryptosporangium aurantiacum]